MIIIVMMCTRIVCIINQRAVTQKLRKKEQPFLYVTCCLDLIHIAMKFHQNFPYGYVVMVRTKTVYAGRMD